MPKGACQQRERHSKFLSYLTGARYVLPWWRGRSQSCNQVPATHFALCGRNLITGLKSAASPRVELSNTCKVGQKLGVLLPLLTCSPSAWSSRLLYCRGRKSLRDIRITLYMWQIGESLIGEWDLILRQNYNYLPVNILTLRYLFICISHWPEDYTICEVYDWSFSVLFPQL